MALLQLVLTQGIELPVGLVASPAARLDLPDASARAIAGGLDRQPIFAPERNQGPSSGAPAYTPLGGYILAGSLSVRGRAIAIVQAPDGSIRRIAPGGSINGLVLNAVRGDGAIFSSGGKTILVAYGRPAIAPTPQDESKDTEE